MVLCKVIGMRTIWKEWPHFPISRVQSSPGNLQVGQVPSNCTRQMPQTSSSGIFHRHVATACHVLILTFIIATKACNDTEALHSSCIICESWSRESCDDETQNRNVAEFLSSAVPLKPPKIRVTVR
jgi:hypothetical protein